MNIPVPSRAYQPLTVTTAGKPIFLDSHSTTMIDPRVANTMMDVARQGFGNPNSLQHSFGTDSNEILVQAKESVARLVGGVGSDVYFTAGATEGIQLAIAHAIGPNRATPLRVAVSRAEHLATIDTLKRAESMGQVCLSWIDTDSTGAVTPERLEVVLLQGTDLVCIMGANNEIGTINPIRELSDLACKFDAKILVDATQAAGWTKIEAANWAIDYLIYSAHKIHGPQGVGALVAPRFSFADLFGLAGAPRPTPNVPGIAGFAQACDLMFDEVAADTERLSALRDRLQRQLTTSIKDLRVNGDQSRRLPYNLHVAVPDLDSDLIIAWVRDKIAISSGAACSSGALGPSHVMRAIALPGQYLDGAIRIGLSRFTTDHEIDVAADILISAIEQLRQ